MDRLELRKAYAGRIFKYRLESVGIDVYLRALYGSDRAKAQQKSSIVEKSKDADNSLEVITRELMSFVISRALVDEAGNRLYDDESADKIGDEISGAGMDEMFTEILRISRLGKGNIEEAVKNSTTTPNESSSSGSGQSSDGGTLTPSSVN